MHAHAWTPITGLPADWRTTLVDAPTHALVQSWLQQADELRTKTLYQEFLTRLGREWAIETGVIEGLYDISEAGTKTLIEQGFQASLLSHDDTRQPIHDVISKIRDQFDALQGLYSFVGGEQPLGTSYVKELHQALTAHQPTFHARDTLGNAVERELPRGVWKMLPSNVEHPDGTSFEFCPPEHVDAEMQRLIALYEEHKEEGAPSDVLAAWLHHRFTLIHPFTDGNGRVARCLATLVLLQANWLPLVVTRSDRTTYVESLRAADDGDLRRLVAVFDQLQRVSIRKAFSLTDRVLDEAPQLDRLLDAARQRIDERRRRMQDDEQRAAKLADSLCEFTLQRMQAVASQTEHKLKSPEFYLKCTADSGPRSDEERRTWIYHQVVEAARGLNYFADRQRYSAWARLSITVEHRTEILAAFHGVGRDPSTVLGAVILAYNRTRVGRRRRSDGAERTEPPELAYGPVEVLCREPFEFTPGEDSAEVQQRFQRWLDEHLLRGLSDWQSTL